MGNSHLETRAAVQHADASLHEKSTQIFIKADTLGSPSELLLAADHCIQFFKLLPTYILGEQKFSPSVDSKFFSPLRKITWDFTGGLGVRNLPSNVGDVGSRPGGGTKAPR